MLEGEITRRRRPAIEMLVIGRVRWHDQGARLPVVALGLFTFLPHQRIALAGQDDHMRTGAVGMAFLVGADRELRDMARHGTLRHIEADVAAAGAALLG